MRTLKALLAILITVLAIGASSLPSAEVSAMRTILTLPLGGSAHIGR
jgi:hypothetical protein